MPTNYPTIIIGGFNIDMLTNTPQSTTLQNYMNKHKLKSFFSKSKNLNNRQINHIWTNAPTQQCHVGSMKFHWTDHKPIYITFKLFFFPLIHLTIDKT
jgi:hypothetical protein